MIRKESHKKEKVRYKGRSYKAKERRNEKEEKIHSPDRRMF
jgi:hypothetical protein